MTFRGVSNAKPSNPSIGPEVARDYAVEKAVCVRPLVREVTDRVTGAVERVLIPCGSTQESVCPPCADKARRLRIQQCSEGWHLAEDPLDDADIDQDPQAGQRSDELLAVADDAEPMDEAECGRRVRSTRRRSDAADLPAVPVQARTIGRTFTTSDGKQFRPSMFVTLTLGSYGRVVPGRPDRVVPGAGTPVSPARYDYRRAAIEAMFFSRLFDRWIQNLRRCAGFVVQYFGAIEPQRRLAPHIHLALRGAIPREVIRQVTKATYLQLWWPSFDPADVVYDEHTPHEAMPCWDPILEAYVDPITGTVLTSWEQALDDLDQDPEARPAAVLRFGNQVDIKGIIAPSPDANRSVRYLTKYLSKAVAETYTSTEHPDAAYEVHIDRLHAELRYLPCSPECANWLRFGIQPRHAGPGLAPGRCPSKSHDREHLGLGGRRVQVSRHWSGKTLGQHRADRATVVREVLAEAGIAPPAVDRLAADTLAADGLPRYVWQPALVESADYATLVLASVIETVRWRREYETAKQRHTAAAGSGGSRASPHGRATA